MRVHTILPLAALASAFVIPEDEAISQVKIEHHSKDVSLSWIGDKVTNVLDSAKDAIGEKIDELANHAGTELSDAESWFKEFSKAQEHNFEVASEEIRESVTTDVLGSLRRHSKRWMKDLGLPAGRCPHQAEDDFVVQDEEDEHHGKRPHKRPGHHKPPHHYKPNHTIYELIKKSKYTTRLAEAVDQFPDIIEALNSTSKNITLFAPTNKAFERIPKKVHIPKHVLEAILAYHVVPEFYPAGRVLKSRTMPSALSGKGLSSEPEKTPQRVSINLGLKGLTLNYYAPVVAIDIPATNGVIHGISKILAPPPKFSTIVEFFPGEFSTLELALYKTGLKSVLNDTSSRLGGTFFTPTNRAFERLGPRANAFLFSRYGVKYLKALIKYHVAPSTTLYSDTLYTTKAGADNSVHEERTFHIDLPTLLKSKSLSIDVAKWARFVDVRINGFYHVGATDLPVYDGVAHFLGHVLIPPKTPGGRAEATSDDIDVDELKMRLEEFVEDEDDELSGELPDFSMEL